MFIERDITSDLRLWKLSLQRRPLLLQGPPCSGKSRLLEEFGRRDFSWTAVFDFRLSSAAADIFASPLPPGKLMDALAEITDVPLKRSRTLIILDNVHLFSGDLSRIAVFGEANNSFHIAAAARRLPLMDISGGEPLRGFRTLDLRPLGFHEYLRTADPDVYGRMLQREGDSGVLRGELRKLINDHFTAFLAGGGFPKAASLMLDGCRTETIAGVLDDIAAQAEEELLYGCTEGVARAVMRLWRDNSVRRVSRRTRNPDVQAAATRLEWSGMLRKDEAHRLWYTDCGILQRQMTACTRAESVRTALMQSVLPDIVKNTYLCRL